MIAIIAMITYVISQHDTGWHVHRHSENVSELASSIASEEEALQIALNQARKDTPSRVMRIAFTGENRIVAEFD
jgi:hypothetical protein